MKRNFKSMIAGVIAVCMCIPMAGCGNIKDSEVNNNSANNSSDTQSDEKDTQEADYSFPTELTDDLLDCCIQIGDDVLTVPTTLRHMHQAGWKNEDDRYPKIHVDGADETTVAMGVDWDSPWSMEMSKSGSTIGVSMMNYTDTIAECFTDEGAARIDIEVLSCHARDNADKTIVLPKGITVNVSTAEDVVAAYGEPKEIKEDFGLNGGGLEGYYYVYYEGKTLENSNDADCCVSLYISSQDDSTQKDSWTVQMVHIKAKK